MSQNYFILIQNSLPPALKVCLHTLLALFCPALHFVFHAHTWFQLPGVLDRASLLLYIEVAAGPGAIRLTREIGGALLIPSQACLECLTLDKCIMVCLSAACSSFLEQAGSAHLLGLVGL